MGLAEPKKKQRIVADPNNLKWADDKGGFGFKMLQKMGWSEGRGLGANLDGTVEHVKVTLKTDSAGLGVTKRDLIEDTYGHTKNFDDLLKSLASTSDDKESKKNKKKSSQQKSKITKDMEEKKKTDKSDPRKSKESRQVSRPHKKKFIQSKNVSNYTEAQLKEIFGV